MSDEQMKINFGVGSLNDSRDRLMVIHAFHASHVREILSDDQPAVSRLVNKVHTLNRVS